MTGPQHYREAEKIVSQVIPTLDKAQRDGVQHESLSVGLSISLAMAQVHATLALAAATALPADYVGSQDARVKDWIEATS